MSLLIIDNYDSFTFNLVQLIEQCGYEDYVIVKNDQLLHLPCEGFDRILISPGPGTASEAGDLMPFLKNNFTKKSILGICLGYEAIGELFGCRLSKLSLPMHGIQNQATRTSKHRVLKNLPERFNIGHYHSWIILQEDICDSLDVILIDELGLPMAVSHKAFDITGLQFHPESIMTDFGKEMIGNWLDG